ncbi:myrosinase 1 [Amyelois transitella]|uniref:myrosinase 1 n=1 Tax=Amyelois transitella TaxID=680683 RepID=UPI00067BB967|nr:myrosinase 1 [Amyelois transitella]
MLFSLVVYVLFSVVMCQNDNKTILTRKLPDGMKLGVASAAYQVEGAWNVADKLPSIWDTLSHTPGGIKDGSTGDDACKSYEYYKRDIQMIKFLGVDFYRFSISWPRILPSGFRNKISDDGLKYYNNLIDELLANNIEPIVTIYHWDLPQYLQDLGGWANPMIADWYVDYAQVLFETFGDRVKTWITINEPKQIGLFGYGMSYLAPRLNAHGIGEYLAAKHILLAHAKAWHLYDKQFRPHQKGTIGITIATDFRTGMTDSPEDILAGSEAMDFEVGLYAHPIFSKTGDFPESVKRRVAERSKEQGFKKSRLPTFTKEEIVFIKGTSDFYGFNHYSTRFYTRNGFKSGMYPIPSYEDDLAAIYSYKDYKPAAIVHCTEIPEGMRLALKWVKDNYDNPPVNIIENGFGTLGGQQDYDRVKYLTRYMDAILDAVEIDGVNVTMYTVWSLMDNFEWANGLSIKFGIFETDYGNSNKTRRPRMSAFWFRNLVATRILDPYRETEFQKLEF